jgi:hypothetical protein
VVVDPKINVEGDRASAMSYFMRVDQGDDHPWVHSMGRYLDQFRRCPDGRWRFLERRAESEGRRRTDPRSG